MSDTPEEAPRRRGRPMGSKNRPPLPPPDGAETVPVEAKKDRAPRRSRKPKPEEVYVPVAAAVRLADTGACMLYGQAWAQQRLNDAEVGALGVALGDEVLRSDRLIALVLRAKEQSVHVKLLSVCFAIAVPRLAAAGKLPPELFAAFAGAPQGEHPQGTPDADSAVPVETGGAYGSDGGHRVGQVDPNGPFDFAATIPRDLPQQIGHGDLQGGQNGAYGAPVHAGPPDQFAPTPPAL